MEATPAPCVGIDVSKAELVVASRRSRHRNTLGPIKSGESSSLVRSRADAIGYARPASKVSRTIPRCRPGRIPAMPRPSRAFSAEPYALEGRLLMAVAPASTPTRPPTVQFLVTTPSAAHWGAQLQVVTQQAGEATLTLSRSDPAGGLQVEVTTDPSSAYVGVIVGAVDQTVTFADGQSQATLTVPIFAGAPNPGAVDVLLNVKPVDPTTTGIEFSELDLRIVASDPTLPPKVVAGVDSRHEILLSFNKPMDPVSASNVKNYSVTSTYYKDAPGLLGLFKYRRTVDPVPLRSAHYDPATQTVTLIPKGRIPDHDIWTSVSRMHRERASARPRHQSKAAPGLTDVQGNPINADTSPGKVRIHLFKPPGLSYSIGTRDLRV